MAKRRLVSRVPSRRRGGPRVPAPVASAPAVRRFEASVRFVRPVGSRAMSPVSLWDREIAEIFRFLASHAMPYGGDPILIYQMLCQAGCGPSVDLTREIMQEWRRVSHQYPWRAPNLEEFP